MIWGQVNLGNVSKAGKLPMKQSENSVLMCEIMYAMFKESWPLLGNLFWGSANLHFRQTVLAEGRQGVAN
jgi:hypothetical protein